ncbi:MAG: glycosyltransferase family 4 protein, partial [Anaerolineales bacterium]|nr:glycosyltransferase family 4 protein [Anaerolineales bacterium]
KEKTQHSQPPLLVLNFVLKGKPALDLLPLIRVAMRSVDQITCLSQREIVEYSRLLNYPLERCRKLQGPFRDHFENSAEAEDLDAGSIFSAGRSHRDYRTLVEAKKALGELAPGWANVPLVINARRFNVKNMRSTADIQINPFLPFELYLASLSAARFAVVPLLPARHASGETFMIQAMTARKAVIASETFSTAEMIESGQNGLLVPPKDPQALAHAMLELLDNPDYARRLGQAAREHYLAEWSFPVAAKKIHQIIQELC